MLSITKQWYTLNSWNLSVQERFWYHTSWCCSSRVSRSSTSSWPSGRDYGRVQSECGTKCHRTWRASVSAVLSCPSTWHSITTPSSPGVSSTSSRWVERGWEVEWAAGDRWEVKVFVGWAKKEGCKRKVVSRMSKGCVGDNLVMFSLVKFLLSWN